MSDDAQAQQMPKRDPALKRLDKCVGTWEMKGCTYVYSNVGPMPMPYRWDVQGDMLTISVNDGPINAAFKGKFSKDGKSFSGGWRPNPGADETINVPYDIAGTWVKWS